MVSPLGGRVRFKRQCPVREVLLLALVPLNGKGECFWFSLIRGELLDQCALQGHWPGVEGSKGTTSGCYHVNSHVEVLYLVASRGSGWVAFV